MSFQRIAAESKMIHDEARAIIARKGLDALLTRYGRTEYGGSYSLNLMTWRDLDIYLVTNSWDERKHFALGQELAALCRPFKMSYRNTVRKDDPRMPLPRGWYWGVYTERFFSTTWKIDCWVMRGREAVKHLKTLEVLNGIIGKRERMLIMRIKHQYCHHPSYRRDFTSMDIHSAVCRGGVGSLSAFRKWLKCERGLE